MEIEDSLQFPSLLDKLNSEEEEREEEEAFD